MKHSLIRTSPKGGLYIGKCAHCGKENLTLSDFHNDICPASYDESQNLIDVIKKEGPYKL